MKINKDKKKLKNILYMNKDDCDVEILVKITFMYKQGFDKIVVLLEMTSLKISIDQ